MYAWWGEDGVDMGPAGQLSSTSQLRAFSKHMFAKLSAILLCCQPRRQGLQDTPSPGSFTEETLTAPTKLAQLSRRSVHLTDPTPNVLPHRLSLKLERSPDPAVQPAIFNEKRVSETSQTLSIDNQGDQYTANTGNTAHTAPSLAGTARDNDDTRDDLDVEEKVLSEEEEEEDVDGIVVYTSSVSAADPNTSMNAIDSSTRLAETPAITTTRTVSTSDSTTSSNDSSSYELELNGTPSLSLRPPITPLQMGLGAADVENFAFMDIQPGQVTQSSGYLLPPVSPLFKGRKCLVLDLDETLVHSSFKYLRSADFVIPVDIDSMVHDVYVVKRPGVDEFMKAVGQLYEVVVFTASVSRYGDPLLDILDTSNSVHHRLFRENCYNYQGNFIKNLSQLGRDLKDIIILDNSPASYIFHPQHAVPISSWFSDLHDCELSDLIPFLRDLAVKRVDDVSVVLDVSI